MNTSTYKEPNTTAIESQEYYYTNSFYFKPDKICPHCAEVIEKGTDLNKLISVKVNCIKLKEKQDRAKFNNR